MKARKWITTTSTSTMRILVRKFALTGFVFLPFVVVIRLEGELYAAIACR